MRSPAYTESFLEDTPFSFVFLLSPTPVLTMEHIYLDLIPGVRRFNFPLQPKRPRGTRRGRGKKHLRYELLVFTSLFHTIKTYTLSHVRIRPALQAAGQTFDIIYCVYRCYGRGIKGRRARAVSPIFSPLRGERKYCSQNPVY
jgi:hypothetical protein